MKVPRIKMKRLLADLDELSRIGRTADGGVCRRAFEPADMSARAWFMKKLQKFGAEARMDAAGNVIGRIGPSTGPAVVSGSHLDTVKNGGFYDGALGALCALEVLRTIKENGLDQIPFEAVAFSDEEERFLGFLGSLAICGQISADDLKGRKDESGFDLTTAMAEAGLSSARISEARRKQDEIKYFVELHIEQGPVLEKEGKELGLVDLVKADYRFGISIKGRRDHAGSPMRGRLDPLVAGVRVIERFGQAVKAAGDEYLFTVGVFEVDPGIQTIIPESVYFTVDIRGPEAEQLDCLEKSLSEILSEETGGMRTEITAIMHEAQVDFDSQVKAVIALSLEEEGHPWKRIMSGPGHDGQVMGRHFPSGMIFVASADGRSHCPQEYSKPQAIEASCNVLLKTMLKLAES